MYDFQNQEKINKIDFFQEMKSKYDQINENSSCFEESVNQFIFQPKYSKKMLPTQYTSINKCSSSRKESSLEQIQDEIKKIESKQKKISPQKSSTYERCNKFKLH